MSPKLSLSTAALCSALFAVPVLPPATDTTAARRDTTSHRPTEGPAPVSARDTTVFTPVFGGANLGGGPAAQRRAE